MSRLLVLTLLGVVLLMSLPAYGQECGDVNESGGGPNIGDIIYLLEACLDNGPAADSALADVDQCSNVDMNDVAYLVNYMFYGGPLPCTGGADCTEYSGGQVTLDHVTGLLDPTTILVDEDVAFFIRYTNDLDSGIGTMANGFRIYSPDGATWDMLEVDTVAPPFPGGDGINRYSMYAYGGSGADTVGTIYQRMVNNSSLDPGQSTVAWSIRVGSFGANDLGKTICIDSAFQGNGLAWKWSTDGLDSYIPTWDGPHCFTIAEEPEALVSIDDVQNGDMLAGTIDAERIVTFDLRWVNNTGQFLRGMTNGFRVYSPDGATWTTTVLDSTGLFGWHVFDLVNSFYYYGVTGSGADTTGVGAVVMTLDGVPDGFDGVPYTLSIGPIALADTGRTVCIDSTFFPPSGTWFWALTSDGINPHWGGPYCFEVVEAILPPYELAVSPDTLDFFAYEGFPSPGSQSMLVEEAFLGDSIEFHCAWVESFVNIPDPIGVTPQMVDVFVSSAGYGIGVYTAIIDVWSDVSINTVEVVVRMTVEAPPMVADSVILPTTMAAYGNMVQPVVTKLVQPIRGASIPLKIPAGAMVDSITTTGLVTAGWEYTATQINESQGWILMGLANSHNEMLPIGETEIFQIHFHPTYADCYDTTSVVWDTALSADPIRQLLFADVNNLDLEAGFDRNRDVTFVPPYTPGDIMANGDIDIADLIYLVMFMFNDGPDLPIHDAADVNGTCTGPNIADLTYLVFFMFQEGPPPQCGCVTGGAPKIAANADVVLSSSFANGITSITVNSSITLRGLQLELSATGEPQNLLGQWDIVHGFSDGLLRVGLLDLDGGDQLAIGSHTILEIPGQCEILSGVISDQNHQDWQAVVRSKGVAVPDGFALLGNYPNPFNPSTEISFSLGMAADVRLEVYNIVGQLVTTLVNEHLEAGTHSVTWSATATQTASGVYFYRLSADDFSETRKMLLLK